MTRRLQAITVSVIWIALAFLMIEHCLYKFGIICTIVSLLASAAILWGGKKLFEWRNA